MGCDLSVGDHEVIDISLCARTSLEKVIIVATH